MKLHKILFCQHVGIFGFILFIVTDFTKFLIGFTFETEEFNAPGNTFIFKFVLDKGVILVYWQEQRKKKKANNFPIHFSKNQLHVLRAEYGIV
jgi:hypothetical protein